MNNTEYKEKIITPLADIFDESMTVDYLWISDNFDELRFDLKSENGLALRFEHWEKLSKLFNTTKINSSDFEISGGCHTCGYGKTYGISFHVMEIPKNQLIYGVTNETN